MFAKPDYTNPNIAAQPPLQFSIRSLLLLTLYTAMAMSAIRICGTPIFPSMVGIATALAGYGLAEYFALRSVYLVVGAYFVGATLGVIAFDHFCAPPIDHWDILTIDSWMIFSMASIASEAGAISAWRFQRRAAQEQAASCDAATRLARIFRNRRLVLQLWAVLIVIALACALSLAASSELNTYYQNRHLHDVAAAAVLVFTVFILASMLAICYDVFHIVRSEIGLNYAVGYMLICVILGPISLIWIPIFLPIVISDDVNRWRKWDQREPIAVEEIAGR